MFKLKKLSTCLLNLIFPKECLGCSKPNTYLCVSCRNKLPDPIFEIESGKILGAVSYKSELAQKAIWTLKYKRAKQLAEPLAELIYERLNIEDKASPTSLIIPIPLSKKRLRERGFNQAELIAKQLSDKLSIKLINNVLYKNGCTVSQVEIKDREKRMKNLKGSFSVKNANLIKDKAVFVVDDVSTTGATINEAHRVLKQAGAKKVIGLVVAKG